MNHDCWHAQGCLSILLWFCPSVFWYVWYRWWGWQLPVVKILSGVSIVELCVIAIHTPTMVVCKTTTTIICNAILFATEVAHETIMRVIIEVLMIIVCAVAVTIAAIGVRAEAVVTCITIGTATSVCTAASAGTAMAITVILVIAARLFGTCK